MKLETGRSSVYQEFFGFDRRPFPTHAAPPLVSTPATDEVLPPLERCVREGGGISILSAPAGTGKTAVVLEIGRRVADNLHVVYLSSSNFTSRRGLLQAILFELNIDYEGLSEQEARLKIIEFSRELTPERDGLVLLVDEADQLSERLLEELRGLANYIHEGQPLLRLVLCGQLGLDERLAAPELDAFNQRVGCHVVLETLDRKQSAEYISETLATCDTRLEEVFSAEALDLICVASDGNVRCLHQLCDHSLLLAFVAEERPVSQETVRSALEDLQELPLNWNVPASAHRTLKDDSPVTSEETPIAADHDDDRDHSTAPPDNSCCDHEATALPIADDVQMTVIEFGGEASTETPADDAPPAEAADSEPAIGDGIVCIDPEPSVTSHEYRLEDRYAELDRLLELNQRSVPEATAESDEVVSLEEKSADEAPESATENATPDTSALHELEGQLLFEIGEMREEVRQVSSFDGVIDELRAAVTDSEPQSALTDVEAEWDVIQPEPDSETLAADVDTSCEHRQLPECDPVEETPLDFASGFQDASITAQDDLAADDSVEDVESIQQLQEPRDFEDRHRRYAFLFTRLRDRRRDVAARSRQ